MKILLVEDDTGIGRFVCRGLAARGYVVAWEREARNVAAILGSGSYAAALLDVGLPDGDGMALCRALRAADIRVPILMLTARATLQDRLDGFDSGADDYLPKPFAFEELVARLAAIVRRGADAAPAPMRYGMLALTPLQRGAAVGDRSLSLSRREFDLLKRLVEAGGAVVSRTTLAASVWGVDAEITDNALDVYIGYLRRHLAAVADAPAIETLRGRGFRLAPLSRPAAASDQSAI